MERREFLKAAAALSIVTDMESFALSKPMVGAGEVHVVGEGQDRFGDKHSLGFSTILFKMGSAETSGNLFMIEHKGLGHGGPPVHVHPNQEEWFYVMEGQVLFQVGETQHKLGPGESVLAPRGIPHGFAGIGEKPAHMLIAFSPAGRMEAFFRDVAVPNGPKMDAETFARYDMKYVGPPLVG